MSSLDDLLSAADIPQQPVYRTGEVARILRLSKTTVLDLCDRYHQGAGFDARALGSFRVGRHHRIPHGDLAAWLTRNQEDAAESC